MEQLAAVEQEIKDLVMKKTCLQKKEHIGTITDEEKIELAGIDALLKDASDNKKFYRELVKLAIKEQKPEVMTFKDADEEWTQSVTGVDTSHRRWTSIVIDETIQPRPAFKTRYEEISKGVRV
jgi:hypothetical protein